MPALPGEGGDHLPDVRPAGEPQAVAERMETPTFPKIHELGRWTRPGARAGRAAEGPHERDGGGEGERWAFPCILGRALEYPDPGGNDGRRGLQGDEGAEVGAVAEWLHVRDPTAHSRWDRSHPSSW